MSLLARLRASAEGRHWPLWVILALALGLRLLRLGFQPLWWDEGWSLYFATSHLPSLLRLTALDIHPPLYYMVLHLWIGPLGAAPLAARLLSALVGTATVPLLYLTGRRLLGERTGLLAALLLAVSPFHIYYSQEVRMYGLVTLLGLVALLFGWRLVEAPPEGGSSSSAVPRPWPVVPWLGYVLAAAAALYTQYYAAFLLLGMNLAVAVRWLRRPLRGSPWLCWLGAQAAVVALYVPWLWYAAPKLLTYVRYKVGIEADLPQTFLPYLARHLAAFGWGHAEGALAPAWGAGLLPLSILLLIATPLFLVRQGGIAATEGVAAASRRWGSAVCALICGTVLLGGFAVNLAAPFDAPRIERQLLLALPAYLLLLAGAIATLWQRSRLAGALPLASSLLIGIVSLGFFYAVPRYPDDDYRPLAARLRALARPSDVVICVHPWQVGYLQSYLPATMRPMLLLTPREVLPEERQVWADDPARLTADLDALLVATARIWVPAHQSMGRILEDKIDAYLSAAGYPVLSEWYGPDTVLSLYAGPAVLGQPVRARFGDWLSLEGGRLGGEPVEAGWGLVLAELTWQLTGRPEAPYIVGLALVDASGRVWAKRDAMPMGGWEPFAGWPIEQPQADRHGLLVPAGTPPGEYRLTLRVYRADDLSPLPVTFEGSRGVEVTLGTVRVVRPAEPPPLEALDMGTPWPSPIRFGNALRFLGLTERTAGPLIPGQAVEVDLFWQAPRAPGEDYLPRLRLLDGEGAAVAELAEKPVAGTYPTAWWGGGEAVRDPHVLYVPATAMPGRYRLVLDLVRAADGTAVPPRRGGPALSLLEVEVAGRERRFEPLAAQHVQAAALGPDIVLTGYDLSPQAPAPGGTVRVTLHWHALATPDRNYHAFVHLLDGAGTIVAQHDGPPLGGGAPTLGWLPGEHLADEHDLALPADLPPGEYRLEVGLYDPVTQRRPGDAVILDVPLWVGTGR